MKIKTRNQFEKRVPEKGKVFIHPSETKPQQSLTILQILDRHQRGMPIYGNNAVPVYTNEYDPLNGVDFRSLDLVERHEIIAETRERIEVLKQSLADQKRLDAETERKKLEEKNKPQPKQLDLEEQIKVTKAKDEKE